MSEIASMYSYPFSGAQGFELDEATLTTYGLEGDRVYILHSTDASKELADPDDTAQTVTAWRRMDGKAHDGLPRIAVARGEDGRIVLRNQQDVSAVLTDTFDAEALVYVNEYGDAVPCHPIESRVAKPILKMLGGGAISLARKSDPWLNGEHIAPQNRAVAPLHIVNMASVDALRESGADFDERRFRAALNLTGFESFVERGPAGWLGKVLEIESEDGLARIQIDREALRCNVTGRDPDSGEQLNDVQTLLRKQDNGRGLGVFGVYGHLLGDREGKVVPINIQTGNKVSIVEAT